MSARQRTHFSKPSLSGLRLVSDTRNLTPVGSVFGRLTVIGPPFYAPLNLDRQSKQLAVCLCSCGAIVCVACQGLNSGGKQSCGCLHIDTVTEQGRRNKGRVFPRKFGTTTKVAPPKSQRLRSEVEVLRILGECKVCIAVRQKAETPEPSPVIVEHRQLIPALVIDDLPSLPNDGTVEYRHVRGCKADCKGYAVGSDGTVITCRMRRAAGYGRGSVIGFGSSWRSCKAWRTGSYGYLSLTMKAIDGTSVTEKLYRMVLKAFVGDPQPGQAACHNDGNPANNALTNLRWDTIRNNHADKRRHGTHRTGEQVYNASITNEQAELIREAIKAGLRNAEITLALGITNKVVESIKSGKAWKSV